MGAKRQLSHGGEFQIVCVDSPLLKRRLLSSYSFSVRHGDFHTQSMVWKGVDFSVEKRNKLFQPNNQGQHQHQQ